MDEDRFWGIIDRSRQAGGDPFDALAAELAGLTEEELFAFRARFDWLVDRAYRNDLWGAAYWINGGCSDDGFHMFRVWLVGQGRATYERAVADPDTLADVVSPAAEGEGGYEADLDVAATRVYEERTGRDDFYDRLDPDRYGFPPSPDGGEDWDFDDADEFRRRFPRLAAVYAADDGDE
jgi:hypothetical protein